MADVLTPEAIGNLPIRRPSEAATWINIMIYGESGVGKTRLAGSASVVEDMGPVLILDTEAGVKTLESCYPDVDVVRVTSKEDLQQVYAHAQAGKLPYRTLILDSLTELQKMYLEAIMRKAHQENEEVDIDVPQIRHWGMVLEQMRRVVRAFRDLPCHTVFTALTRESKDRHNLTKIGPGLSGRLGGEVAAFLDVVGHLYVKKIDNEPVRCLLTSSMEGFIAKDRSARLPAVLQEPTMQDIWGALNTSGEE